MMNLSALQKPKLNFSALQKPVKVGVFDVAREIPGTLKTLGQDIVRNIGSMGVSIGKLLGGAEEITPPKSLQFLFRDEPIKSVEQRVAEAELKLKDYGQQRQGTVFGDIASKYPKSLAFAGIMGSVGIDLTPFGGLQKNALKALVKTKTPQQAISVLTKMGVADDLAKTFADDVVKVNTTKSAKALFNNIANLQKTTKPVLNTSALTGKSKPLAQEARKYKSADEFVKAQSIYYHGTNAKFDKFDLSKLGKFTRAIDAKLGFHFTKNKNIASSLGKNVKELYLDIKNPFDLWGDFVGNQKKYKELYRIMEAKKKGVDFKEFASILDDGLAFDNAGFKVELLDPNVIKNMKRAGYDGLKLPHTSEDILQAASDGAINLKGSEVIPFELNQIKTKSQLTDIYTQATKGVEKKPLQEIFGKTLTVEKGAFKGIPVVDKTGKEITKIGENVPAVIQGETFTLGTGRITQPTIKELKTGLKAEIKATQKEIKLAETATKKAERLEIRQQKIRTEAIKNINREHGNTDRIIKSLKKKHLSDEDIANVVLEDGTKLTDTLKVKRNPDKSLAAIIRKSDIDDIVKSYTAKILKQKWAKVGILERTAQKGLDIGKLYELPQVWFERKGLNKLYEPIIEAGRAAEYQRTTFINKFKEAGLWKKQGWFTADRFNLSKSEADNIGKYFLSRQKKGYKVALEDLSTKEKKFVEVFDSIIDETEPRFYEVAKKNGKTPGKVENYAPIMTREDIELIDKAGAMDFIFRKHPSFFSLKERVKKVPVDLYETDYRRVAARWMDGITEFLNTGEVSPELKYLIDSDQFKNVITEKDYSIIYKWLKDVLNPRIPETAGGEAVDWTARLLKKGAAIASLGLNYASVAKQALTQIPIMIIERVRPKFKSQYAKAFGIKVSELASLTKRKGDIAITDLQGRIGRIFTGALTEFDRKNAQLSMNALLDKEYTKFLKKGAEITPEIQKIIEKKASDTIDLWYGGFFKGQKPEAFRSSLGQFVNMFIYPLTSQLNGFYRNILQARGVGKTAIATAEVMAAATAIAYMEVAITKLSFNWSDELEMTKDVTQSLLGNIPIVSQISYALMEDQQLQVSAGLSGITNLGKKIPQYIRGEKEGMDILFAGAEIFGLPKQIRRIKEGIEIINEGGITDKEGKMLAPVKEADEMMRSILRGKYGSMASQDWIRNIGEKKENRRWFVPQVEFLQNGDCERKAELYKQFTPQEQKELRGYLSETQQKKLDKALGETTGKRSLEDIFKGGTAGRKSLEDIFK